MRRLATTATAPAADRFRAHKVLADLSRYGRLRLGQPGDDAVAAAGFAYLEGRLCVDCGVTHYSVSATGDGVVWLLVERTGDYRGGLNLRWDAGRGRSPK